jgi:hypothetical protein
MKKQYVVVFTLIAAALFFGCSTSGPQQAQNANLPEFVLNPPQQEDAIFGIGSAKMSDPNSARRFAESRARTSLAFQLNANVQAMITDYSRQAGTEGSQAQLNFAESIERQVTQVQLNGATPVKTDQTPDGTIWVMVAYKKADAAKAAAGIIENEASKYAEFKAMDALKQMEAQLDKINTKPEIVEK